MEGTSCLVLEAHRVKELLVEVVPAERRPVDHVRQASYMRLIIVGPTEGVGILARRLGLLGIGWEGQLRELVVSADLRHLWVGGA